MARIQVIEESKAEGGLKVGYDSMREQLGFVPNVMKLFSLWPEVFELDLRQFETVMLTKTELPNPIKEMIALVVSETNSCHYCVGHHTNFLQQYGIPEEVIRQVGADFRQSTLDEKTLRLLEYARKVTQHAYKVTPEDIASLRQLGWADRQILEATVVVGRFNAINRIVDALGVELEPVVL